VIEIIQSTHFSKWLTRLKDRKARSIVLDRLLRMQHGNAGDVKAVGEGVYEARIHYGPGYRLYYIQRDNVLIVMLAGGDKANQEKDIKQAKALAKEWREQ
jgi:putative addiction module killer protein